MNPGESATESLPISALQHWLFCPRQCALIHVERLWEENRLTAEGRILHERADAGIPESRDGIRVLRSVQVASHRLGLHGVVDVVELRRDRPYPVEYKRGRPKAHRADEAQLCAQALCLEEMTGQEVPEGALFYGQRRRREVVPFDDTLRGLVATLTDEIHACLASGLLPAPLYDPARCDSCSLIELCRPQGVRQDCAAWLAVRLVRAEVPE